MGDEEVINKLMSADSEELWDKFREYTADVVSSVNEERRPEAIEKAGKLYALSTLMKFRGMV